MLLLGAAKLRDAPRAAGVGVSDVAPAGTPLHPNRNGAAPARPSPHRPMLGAGVNPPGGGGKGLCKVCWAGAAAGGAGAAAAPGAGAAVGGRFFFGLGFAGGGAGGGPAGLSATNTGLGSMVGGAPVMPSSESALGGGWGRTVTDCGI
jgi:hypothetical protein